MKIIGLIILFPLFTSVFFTGCEKIKDSNDKYALVTTSIVATRKDASVSVTWNISNPNWLKSYNLNDDIEYINPDYYEVYLSKNTSENWEMIRTIDNSNRYKSFTLTGLTNNEPYYVYLKAISDKVKNSKSTNIAMFVPSTYKPTYSFIMKDYYGHDIYSFDRNNINNSTFVYATEYYEFKPNFSAAAIFIARLNNEPQFVDINCWSPDYNNNGTKIVYSSVKDEIFDGIIRPEHITIYDINTNQITRVTSGYSVNKYPVWAPDNSLIAFSSSDESDKRLVRITVLNPETQEHKILETQSGLSQEIIGYSQINPAWSSDGKYIYYTLVYATNNNINPGYYDIYRIKSEGGIPEPVFDFNGVDCSPQISPDNSKLAFLTDLNGKLQIWVYYFKDKKFYQPFDTNIYSFMNGSHINWKDNKTILFTAYSEEKGKKNSLFSMSIE